LYLKVQVSIDPADEIGNRLRCPIANSIVVGDRDVMHASATSEEIRFSRRSDGMRYVFETPPEGKDFIDALDRLADEDEIDEEDWPEPFTLRLRHSDVISITKRRPGTTHARTNRPAVTKTVGSVMTGSKKTGTTIPKGTKKKAAKKAKGSRSRRPIFR
jgi:hypothetical protein